ncbi:MAG: hypothetical protein ABID09_07875 [Candidatus Omnitrophota bacterium]
MKRLSAILLIMILLSLVAAGCGETFSGLGKDARRVGKGTKTIFIRED